MVRSRIAQQHRLAAACQQRLRDGARHGCQLFNLFCRQMGVGSLLRHGGQRHAFFNRHGHGNGGQSLRPVARVAWQRRMQRHGPIGRTFCQRAHLRTLPHCLTDTLGKQRVIFAQIAANHQRPIQLAQFGNGHAQPAHLALRISKFGMPQAIVDVAAVQCAHQLRGQPQFFHRAVRAGQQAHAGGAFFLGNVAQTAGSVFQRRLPVHFQPAPILFDHGLGQAVGAVERLVAETIAVGDPAFVHGLVLERHHAQYAMVFDLHNQIGTGRVVRADAFAA